MSQDLHVYLIELEAFRAVQGSGDQGLLRRVLKTRWKRIERHDDYFRNTLGLDPYQPLAEAVRQIVDGEIDKDFAPKFQFEHAAALIASVCGEPLDASMLLETKASFNAEVDQMIGALRTTAKVKPEVWPTLGEILLRGPLMQVPLDERMRLGSGYLAASQALRAMTVVHDVDFNAFEPDGRYVWPERTLAATLQYVEWLTAAVAAQSGLFLHR